MKMIIATFIGIIISCFSFISLTDFSGKEIYTKEEKHNSNSVKSLITKSNVFNWDTYRHDWGDEKLDVNIWKEKIDKIEWNEKVKLSEVIKSNIPSLHYIDVNKDGFGDIIYYGESGSESLISIIFIFNKGNYNLSFISYGESICGLNVDNGSVRLITFSEPVAECSDEYIFSYVLRGEKWKRIGSVVLIDYQLKIPNRLYIENSNCKINRGECIVWNSPIEEEMSNKHDLENNMIGVITRDTKIEILHETKGKNDKYWCFVKIEDNAKKTNFIECLFDHSEFKDLIVYGWICKDFCSGRKE